MLKANRQFTDLARIYSIPRRKLLWQDVEKKYGSPDELNVEGYFIDDEPEIKEKEKRTGKERKPQEELQRERQREGSREQDQRDYQDYIDNKIDFLSGYDQYY